MDEDMSYIHSLSQGPVKSFIIVRAFDYPYTKLERIRIEIEGNGVKYQGVTDKEGELIVPIPGPGTYLIRGTFSAPVGITAYRKPHDIKEREESTTVEYQEEIKSGRCAYVEFIVMMIRKNLVQR